MTNITKQRELMLQHLKELNKLSLKANIKHSSNVEKSLNHKIDWVYKRKHLPVMILSEFGHWRKVTDFEDYTGWIYKDLLSGSRYIIVNREQTLLRNKASFNSLGKAVAIGALSNIL